MHLLYCHWDMHKLVKLAMFIEKSPVEMCVLLHRKINGGKVHNSELQPSLQSAQSTSVISAMI